MDIRFISTLTSDDEDILAPMLLNAASSVLDGLPLAYTLRIETTARTVFTHSHPAAAEPSGSESAEEQPSEKHGKKVPVPQC